MTLLVENLNLPCMGESIFNFIRDFHDVEDMFNGFPNTTLVSQVFMFPTVGYGTTDMCLGQRCAVEQCPGFE